MLSGGRVQLSDSLPPATLIVELNRCPVPVRERSVSLACVHGIDGTGAMFHTQLSPSGGAQLTCSVDAGRIRVPFTVSALAAFRGGANLTSLTCTLTGNEGSVAMGSATVEIEVCSSKGDYSVFMYVGG